MAFPAGRWWRDTGPDGDPGRHRVRRTRPRARGTRPRARLDSRRARARPCWSPEKRASARPGSRPSWPRERTSGASRYSSGARSTSSARSCPTSRSSRRCARSGQLPQVDPGTAGSQLRMFQDTLALLSDHAAAAPVLLVLEDVHWADASTLDLFLFLAYNVADHRLLLLATYRPDELSSAERMGRFAAAVRRSGSGLVLELGPLDRDEVTALLAAHAGRSAARRADRGDRRSLRRQPVLRRRAPHRRRRRRSGPASSRAACATCCYSGSPSSTLRRRACCGWPRPPDATSATRCCGRWPRARSTTCTTRSDRRSTTAFWSPSRRPADSASATPCSPRRSTRRSCPASARSCTRSWPRSSRAAERPRRRSSRRTGPRRVAAAEALAASVDAARQAEAVFGLAEAHAHLERALALWPAVPDAAELAGARPRRALLAGRPSSPAEIGAAPRAVELGGERSSSSATDDPRRAPRSCTSARRATCIRDRPRRCRPRRVRARGRARARASRVSPERAHALAAFANGLMLAWRHAESVGARRAGARPRPAVGAGRRPRSERSPSSASISPISGAARRGSAHLRQAMRLRRGDRRPHRPGPRLRQLDRRAHDAGTARTSRRGWQPRRSRSLSRYGLDTTMLVANQIEALLAIGEWDEADRLSAARAPRHHRERPASLRSIIARHARDRARRFRGRARTF